MPLTQEQLDQKFGITRPDEVAECWDGVLAVPGLYEALWACAPLYNAPRPEVSEEPCYGMDCVARFWGSFSPTHQEALARLEEENAAQ